MPGRGLLPSAPSRAARRSGAGSSRGARELGRRSLVCGRRCREEVTRALTGAACVRAGAGERRRERRVRKAQHKFSTSGCEIPFLFQALAARERVAGGVLHRGERAGSAAGPQGRGCGCGRCEGFCAPSPLPPAPQSSEAAGRAPLLEAEAAPGARCWGAEAGVGVRVGGLVMCLRPGRLVFSKRDGAQTPALGPGCTSEKDFSILIPLGVDYL